MYPQPRLHIDGVWREGGGDARLPVVNPATGETIGTVRAASAADLASALAAAERGFRTWRATPPHVRGRVLRKAADLIRDRADAIARLLTLEEGKPLAEARGEVESAADVFEWFAEEGRRAYGRVLPARAPGARHLVLREPVGPVAAFTPWNFPALTPARKIAGALAAGCSCIIKPAEETPATCMALVDACVDAGLPAGVLNLVLGVPAEVSATLIASPVIRKVSFTGSTAVGTALLKLAADGVKRVTMELGGHAPVVVFEDAEVEAVADQAVAAKFRNAGQVCVSPTRFLVQRGVFARFVDRFVERARALRVGDGFETGVQMGPLANARRLGAVERTVADARSRGARVLTGGERLGDRGFFYAPTVLVDVPLDAKVMTEEPFGPVAPIVPFDTFDEAVRLANALPFGLAAYAFSRASSTVAAIADALEAGMVAINQFRVSLPEAPFGGVKASGYGSEGGQEGLDAYLVTKFVNQA
ncbi:MAG TPA: NAD-dependent succinate-semialdehyde dehydrogenase [Thermodesulfobacteriota bacterium]